MRPSTFKKSPDEVGTKHPSVVQPLTDQWTDKATSINGAERHSGPAEKEKANRLQQLGIHTPRTLEEACRTQAKQPFLVHGVIRPASIKLLVGDSGLGKTPFCIQAGVCVAAGIPLFGLQVKQGPVLYADAESGLSDFRDKSKAISRYLGLSEPPPDFYVWSPNWDMSIEGGKWGDALMERVSELKPALVIADPLRLFWSNVEGDNEEVASLITSLRELSKAAATAWLILHHCRKPDRNGQSANLVQSPHQWFKEAAGAHGIVNHSDTRLGAVPGKGQSNLVIAGFMRGAGPIAPLYLGRITDDSGDPIAYHRLIGVEQLAQEERTVFNGLDLRFRFKDVKAGLEARGGNSDSNANRLIKKYCSLGLAKSEADHYIKTATLPETVEPVE